MNLRPFGPKIGTYVLYKAEKPTVSSCSGFCIGAFSQGKTYYVALLLYAFAVVHGVLFARAGVSHHAATHKEPSHVFTFSQLFQTVDNALARSLLK